MNPRFLPPEMLDRIADEHDARRRRDRAIAWRCIAVLAALEIACVVALLSQWSPA